MPLTSPSPTELDAEDFRRLGVRPHECRLDVIRRAAARSARALAEQQLDAPSEQVGLQLSRVATSAYRLLDPRQRRDSNQRVHIARIVPVTLTLASLIDLNRDTAASPVTPFQNASDAEPTESSESESSSDFDWTIDLIVEGRHQGARGNSVSARRSTLKRTKRQLRWATSVAGLFAVSILGLAAMRSDLDQPRLPEERTSVTHQPQPSQLDSTERSMLPQPIASEPDASLSPASAEPAATLSAADVQTPKPTLAPSLADTAARTTDQPAVPTPQLSNERPLQPELSAAEIGNGEFLPDPFASLATTAGSSDDRMRSAQTEPEERSALEASLRPQLPQRRAMPDQADVRAAREQLVALVPELALAVTPKDVPGRIAAVESIQQQLKVGSVDYWTARLQVAQLAWLVEDASQVGQRVAALPETYSVPILLPLSESFINACDLATLPKTQRHLVDQGWGLADRLLIARSFEQSRNVLERMQPLIEALELEDLRSALNEWLLAIEQMERLANAESRMLDDAGRIDSEKADGKVLGRFYCLMLRDWDAGLPWLAESSNPRIASVARQESELGDGATADERIELGQLWMTVASRSSGRAADSMQLHAIDLLRRAAQQTSGLKQLETEREIDQALERLPAFLRRQSVEPPAGNSGLPAENPAGLPAENPAGLPAENSSLPAANPAGLSGRIEIDGQDAGVQLDYPLGAPLTQTMLDTIGQKLKRDLGAMTIRLVGEFQLEEPTVVHVSIMLPPSVSQELEVDGGRINLATSARSVQLSLQPGRHQIGWSFEVTGLSSPAALRLEELTSGRMLNVVQPSRSPGLRTTLTVSMVPGQR